MQILIFVLALCFELVCSIYDATMTEKGLRAGVGIEANAWLLGAKPKALRLYLKDLLFLSLVTAPSVIAAAFGMPELFYGFLIGPVFLGLKHVQGGRQWRWMLLNPTKKLPEPGSVWQQFLGVWV